MKRFQVVLAGCGGMANAWVDYAKQREDTEIVGLVDVVPAAAAAMAERKELSCPQFTDLKTAITETKASLVFDVTIPESHRQVVTTALEMGCDVLGEKPMGASLTDARAMLEVAQRTGKTYAVMQNRRYLRQIRALRDIVSPDTIGETGFVNADFFLGPHFGGFRDLMDHVLILDMAIHTFDQARFITKADPVSVYCHEFNPKGSWYKGNASAVAIFEMSDGSVFCYRGSWCAEGAPTSWESSWRITGSRGTAIWDGSTDPFYEHALPSEEKNFWSKVERKASSTNWQGREGHPGCLDEMFSALVEGRKPETDCSDNIHSVEMVFGAIESAKRGEKVMISDL